MRGKTERARSFTFLFHEAQAINSLAFNYIS